MSVSARDGDASSSGQGPREAGQAATIPGNISPSPRIYGNQNAEPVVEDAPQAGISGSLIEERPKSVFSELVSSLSDPIELAALVKLQSCDQIEPGKFTVEQAIDTISWALETDVVVAALDTDLAGMAKTDSLRRLAPKDTMTVRKAYRAACSVLAILLVLFCVYVGLSVAVYVLTQEVSVDEQGILLGARNDGQSTVVTTGSAVVLRPLMSYLLLGASELRRVKDAVFMHKGTWHCIRVARTVKYSSHHMVFHSHDGSAVRLQEGKAYFQNNYGPWEIIDFAESEKYSSRLSEYEARWLLHGAFAADTVAAPVGYSASPLGFF
jgi:hypothetical protein